MNAGHPHIFERDLDQLLPKVIAQQRFRATIDLAGALSFAETVIIAVGTPSNQGTIDLTFVRAVARAIGTYLKSENRFFPVVVKSTVLPGTTDTVIRTDIEAASGKMFGQFGLGMNPEFLREGEAISDFMDPGRIVLGHDDKQTLASLEELYKPWGCDKLRVNTRTAELIKYATNALLATQISAVNEIANLAAALGDIDAMNVMKGVHLDKRWSPVVEGHRISPEILTYLVPGCGFGGSCLPKDVQAMRAQGRERGLPMHMLGAVLDVNGAQPSQVIELLRQKTILPDASHLLLGLAFKPGTDDVRESASIQIARALLTRGAKIVAHDPIAADNFKAVLGESAEEINFVSDWRGEIPQADVIIIATKWPEYAELQRMDLSGKVLFDARRMFSPDEFAEARYLTIGRRPRD